MTCETCPWAATRAAPAREARRVLVFDMSRNFMDLQRVVEKKGPWDDDFSWLIDGWKI